MPNTSFDQVMSLAKRRGFIYPSSEIYGGMANTYDYGPMGTALFKNLKNYWWDYFVTRRENMLGLEASVLVNPKVWEASGHTQSFADALIECKSCHVRTRADHVIENFFDKKNDPIKVEGKTESDLEKLIADNHILCPECGGFSWTPIRRFNLLFQTNVGIVQEAQSRTYLRGETAQGMFINFKAVMDSLAPKIPFGLAQSGKVFRNEITKGQGVFRTLEFELAEFEFFVKPQEWEQWHEFWKKEIYAFAQSLGIDETNLRWRSHTQDELSHYSSRTEDLEYKFPFGFKEWYAVAYRSDFDLKNHMEKSGVDLRYTDRETGEKFIPHVIEPTFGLSRSLLVLLSEHLKVIKGDKPRTVLSLPPFLAPYKVAVFPLLKNKPELVTKARSIFIGLLKQFPTVWDERGNIGKRYYAQDEIGTPVCVTVDFDSLKDDTITVRDRDTAVQTRIDISKLVPYIENNLKK